MPTPAEPVDLDLEESSILAELRVCRTQWWTRFTDGYFFALTYIGFFVVGAVLALLLVGTSLASSGRELQAVLDLAAFSLPVLVVVSLVAPAVYALVRQARFPTRETVIGTRQLKYAYRVLEASKQQEQLRALAEVGVTREEREAVIEGLVSALSDISTPVVQGPVRAKPLQSAD